MWRADFLCGLWRHIPVEFLQSLHSNQSIFHGTEELQIAVEAAVGRKQRRSAFFFNYWTLGPHCKVILGFLVRLRTVRGPADAASDFVLEPGPRALISHATMASPEVAVPFLRAPAVKFGTAGRSKRNSQISVTAAPALPEIYPWAASLSAAVDAESTAERDDKSAMSLPVIDLGGLRSGDPSAREQIIKELGAATEAFGFFQVVNHSVTDELQDRMHEQARQFFNLPMDVKKRAEIDGPNPRSFGYKGTQAWDTERMLLLKESLADSRDPSCSVDNLATKIWPGGNVTFSNTVQEHCLSVEALGHQLLELLAESVGVQRDFYSRHFKKPATRSGTWRLHHFPPNLLPFNVFRTVPHSDPSVLTLLKQDVAGLQVKKPGGSVWIDVKPLPGSFVVNVGDILEAWSNGRFPSVEHRVALHKERERFSMVIFFDAQPSLHIEAPPELIDDEHPSLFVPFVASDFRANFDKGKRAGDISKGKALDCVRRSRRIV